MPERALPAWCSSSIRRPRPRGTSWETGIRIFASAARRWEICLRWSTDPRRHSRSWDRGGLSNERRTLVNRSGGILPVLALLAWLAPPAAAQEVVWIDTQFHRVYLRNGNFIDGKIVQVNNREVHLDVVPGSMTFRLDMVDRIELIKMRTLG